MSAAVLSAVLIAVLAVSLAPTSAADATENLKSRVDAARGGCPPLQPDPVLTALAERQNNEQQAFLEHSARFVPFTDPLPMLRALGHNAGKARLLSGFGDTEAKSIHGAILQGWEAIPDCTYTRYGANVLDNAGNEYVLAALVVAGDYPS